MYQLLSDREVVEEVVRVSRGRAQPPWAVPPLAMDPGMWFNMVNVKPPYLVDLEVESMKKIFWSIRNVLRNVLSNYSGRCSNSFWKSTWILCAVNPAKKWRILWPWNGMNLSPLCCVYMQRILVGNGAY